MKIPTVALLVPLLVFGSICPPAQAADAPSPGKVSELIRLLAAEAQADTDKSKPRDERTVESLLDALAWVDGAVGRGHFDVAARLVRREILRDTTTPRQRARLEELKLPLLELAREQERKLEAEIDVLLERAQRILANAQVPADLDALLQEFAKALLPPNQPPGEPRVFSNEDPPVSLQQLAAAQEFVKQWQKFLTESGRADKALSHVGLLESLAQKAAGMPRPPVARSELLRRASELDKRPEPPLSPSAELARAEIAASAQAQSALSSVTSLEQLARVIAELPAPTGRRPFETDPFEKLLEFDQRMEREKEVNLRQFDTVLRDISSRFPRAATHLRTEMISRALPLLLELPPGLRQQPNEARNDFLRRVVADASSRRDWRILARAARLRDYLRDSINALGTLRVDNDGDGYGNLVAGEVSERAGQMEQAALRYLDALRLGGADLPVEHLAERLTQLREQQPKAYQAAMREALSRGFR